MKLDTAAKLRALGRMVSMKPDEFVCDSEVEKPHSHRIDQMTGEMAARPPVPLMYHVPEEYRDDTKIQHTGFYVVCGVKAEFWSKINSGETNS